MSLFRNRLFTAVTLGHFTIDLLASPGAVIVAFLSDPLNMTASQVGLAISAYQLFNAASQPIFGWFTDRIGSRWLGPGSLAWTAFFYALSFWVARTTESFWLFFIVFSLAALGVGAFHPMGTMYAATASSNRAATGTSVFFLFGQTGLAAGPIVAGYLLDSLGDMGIYLMALIAIPVVGFMNQAMFHLQPIKSSPKAEAPSAASSWKADMRWGAITILAAVIGFRSWVFIGTAAFIAKLFQDMGWSPTAYGAITGMYWMSSAIAGVVCGNLADRFGRRQVVFTTLLLGAIPIYFLPLNSTGLAFFMAILAGGLLGASHSIIVVIAQDLLPGSKSFASGVTLGYLFGTGAIATWVMGRLADVWGLSMVIQWGVIPAIVAAMFALILPKTRLNRSTLSTKPLPVR